MSTWKIQPSFGAALEEELFAELDAPQVKKEESYSGSSDGDEEEENSLQQGQPWTHLCILDFEACREKLAGVDEWLYEITELPVEDSFHRYCKPAAIAPDTVERYVNGKYGAIGQADAFRQESVSLQTALEGLEEWLAGKGLLSSPREDDSGSHKFAFVTCGDWDFKHALPRNCHLLGLPVPRFMRQWINIKTVYHKFYNTRRPPAGMTAMLRGLDIPMEGTHHFGKDDAHNITKIVQRMISDGCTLFITGREADMWDSRTAGEEREATREEGL